MLTTQPTLPEFTLDSQLFPALLLQRLPSRSSSLQPGAGAAAYMTHVVTTWKHALAWASTPTSCGASLQGSRGNCCDSRRVSLYGTLMLSLPAMMRGAYRFSPTASLSVACRHYSVTELLLQPRSQCNARVLSIAESTWEIAKSCKTPGDSRCSEPDRQNAKGFWNSGWALTVEPQENCIEHSEQKPCAVPSLTPSLSSLFSKLLQSSVAQTKLKSNLCFRAMSLLSRFRT